MNEANMKTVSLQLPEEVFSAVRRSPEEFVRDMRLAAAMLWYSRGEISQEKGALIAGMNRVEFLDALAKNGMDVFLVDFDQLDEELKGA